MEKKIGTGRVRALTTKQIKMLQNCPHVVSFTNSRITWSTKFLNDICALYDKGEHLPKLLRGYGIDPDILTDKRIATIRVYYTRTWKPLHYDKELRSSITHSGENDGSTSASEVDPTRRNTPIISKLEHDVAYLTQEVEFLKKIFIADNKQFKERQRHQRNTK